MKITWIDDRGNERTDPVLSAFTHDDTLFVVIPFHFGLYTTSPHFSVLEVTEDVELSGRQRTLGDLTRKARV